jgi:beta-lactamase regulating signal transducer with metallopeptidase domain
MSIGESLNHLAGAGEAVWRASWQASVLAGLVLAIQLTIGRRLAPRWRHAMWMLVFVRLALPVVPSSPLSVFNLAPRGMSGAAPVQHDDAASVTTTAGTLSTTEFAAEMRARAANFVPGQTGAETVVAAAAVVDAPAVPAPPAKRLWQGWPQALAAVWAAGALLLLARIAWATLRVSRTMRRLRRVEDESVLDVLRATAAELRVRRLPVLLTGDGLFSPALVGFVRPRLLLPQDLLSRFECAELRLVLLHELAHLKRRDVLVNWIATLLTVLHWPNPVAWLVAWRLRLERELACDELVMSRTATDADRRAYGHTIVKLLETFARPNLNAARPVPAGGVGILEGRQQMKRRITLIARFATRNRAWTVVAASLVLGLGVVALTDAAEQPAAGAPPTQSANGATPPPVAGPAEAGAGKRLPTVIAPDELVTVSIMGLVGPDVETVKTSRADADGNIRLPYIGEIKAQGLKPGELEKAIAKAYVEKNVIQNPLVMVSLPGRGESHQLSSKKADAGMPDAGQGGGSSLRLAGDRGGQGVSDDTPRFDPSMAPQLDRKLPEVNFDAVAFSDVVDFLRDVTSANIFVDWRALEAAGIDRNAPVTARLRDISFKDAMTLILRGISHELTFTGRNGVLQIEIADEGAGRPAQTVVRAYEVDDLIGMAGNPKGAAAELAKVVTGTVKPDYWRDPAGGPGTVSAFGNKLIVTASEPVHRQVAELLKVLREPPKDAVKAEDMTNEQIAEVDPQIGKELQTKREIELQIEQMKRQGIGQEAVNMKQAADALKRKDDEIENHRVLFVKKFKGYYFTPGGGMQRGTPPQEKAAGAATADPNKKQP